MALTEVSQILEKFERDFDPQAAEGVDAVIQYHISGDGCGEWQIAIKDGACKIETGVHEAPTVTFRMGAKTWLGLLNKTVNPTVAFTTGRIRIKGDMGLAQSIPKFFQV
ncbi:MAG: SCP2 sterol-binding domain-containing protein [Desulfobacterales bacterium]|nr:SCP2 sterol-binding domain-containing protein [Desulfobacterales bacterium]